MNNVKMLVNSAAASILVIIFSLVPLSLSAQTASIATMGGDYLSITKNGDYGNQTFSANSKNQHVGSFKITNNASESVVFNIKLGSTAGFFDFDFLSTTMLPTSLTNVRVVSGESGPNALPRATIWNANRVNLSLPGSLVPNSSLTFDVYADIGSIGGTFQIGARGLDGMGVSSGALYFASLAEVVPVPGQIMTISASSITTSDRTVSTEGWSPKPALPETYTSTEGWSPKPTNPAAVGASATMTKIIPAKFGDKGDNVTAIQKVLIAKGFLLTDATGYFGTKTRLAVKAFQKANGISSLGVIGSKTIAMLLQEK
jgi:hypothetical protein